MTGIEEIIAAAGDFLASDTVLSAAGAAAAGAAVNYALQPKPSTPQVKPPVAMPNQQAVDDARRRALIDQMNRRGRASTILTDSGDTLG